MNSEELEGKTVPELNAYRKVILAVEGTRDYSKALVARELAQVEALIMEKPTVRLGPVMSNGHGAIVRRGWPGVILWALLVMASVVLMVTGLWRSMFIIGYWPTPAFEEDARVGALYILAGTAASIAASAWSFLRGHPHWVTACAAAPAIIVGGAALIWPTSMLRHLAALFALPGAMAGMVGGLADRGYRRTSSTATER